MDSVLAQPQLSRFLSLLNVAGKYIRSQLNYQWRARCQNKSQGHGHLLMYSPEYRHKFIPWMTCQLVKQTKRGWQVLQKDDPLAKPKTKFFESIYFSKDKGIWEKITS